MWFSALNPPQENKAARSTIPRVGPPVRESESVFTERKLESFVHGTRPEWGYAAPQRDKFLVLHPTEGKPELNGALVRPPLYVVLHSAGHNVDSCLACTATVGNHDIYRAPPEFFALYVDCRANKGDWWWGIEKYKGSDCGEEASEEMRRGVRVIGAGLYKIAMRTTSGPLCEVTHRNVVSGRFDQASEHSITKP
ncbi:MAG: hypothetical protein R3C01_09550 [Planctomycetaceae bacterium]